MSNVQLELGSFRDPSGHVYQREGRIYRTVMPAASHDYEFVRKTGIVDALIQQSVLLGETVVSADVLGKQAQGAAYILEHPVLPYVSYPYEWCFSQLQRAALLHLTIQLTALEYGVALVDASAYNVQFQGAEPVFIDHLSFVPYHDGDYWLGHRQFCEQFINPLLLASKLHVNFNHWYRGAQEGIDTVSLNNLLKLRHKLSLQVFIHVVMQARFKRRHQSSVKKISDKRKLPKSAYRHMLEGLKSWVAKLKPPPYENTVWSNYTNQLDHYQDSSLARKHELVARFVQANSVVTVHDIGCNTGEYAELCLQNGAKHVVGYDFDQGAVEQAYRRAQEKRLNFLPLVMSAVNPSPAQGWAQQERQGFVQRADADAVIALAVIHHLAIGANIPLAMVVDWLLTIAPCGLVEFVPKSDPMVKTMLALRKDIFDDYTEANFLACLEQYAVIEQHERIPDTERSVVIYRRKEKAC